MYKALEEYVVLTKQLSSLQSKMDRIKEYKKILKSYRDTSSNLKVDLINDNKAADEYLESETEYFSKLRDKFSNYAKNFYPKKKSGLVLKTNYGENQLRYELDTRIEDDSSDGVNEARMFCFDLLLLVSKQSDMRFIAHDSRLFANMDPRQREKLFRIVHETCKEDDLQYFCSINEDALCSFQPLMSAPDFKQIVTDNIILELKDDAPESKLLGIQIDIDLEDKKKSINDIN